jgi:hypothetical protein
MSYTEETTRKRVHTWLDENPHKNPRVDKFLKWVSEPFWRVEDALMASTRLDIASKRLRSLFSMKRIQDTWGLVVLITAVVFAFLPGGSPLLSNGEKITDWDHFWLGMLMVWSIQFLVFAQEGTRYYMRQPGRGKPKVVDGNKGFFTYLLALDVTLVTYWLIGTKENTWFFMLCGFVQLFPLFMKKTLQEQAENFGPHLVTVAILINITITLVLGV